MQLNISTLCTFLNHALLEDHGIAGDITSDALLSKDHVSNFRIIAKQDLIFCGSEIAEWYFNHLGIKSVKWECQDGQRVSQNQAILEGNGATKSILLLERVLLNFLQHLSGIATYTNKFVEEVEGFRAKIADTRKTIPGLRMLQKYAVRCGGGINHRLALDSAIMIKDNHIIAEGSLKNAYDKALISSPHYTKIIIECDTIELFHEATSLDANIILLDNMSPENIKYCVEVNQAKAIIEVSGGINLGNVKRYAQSGPDIISVGAITHSSPAADISLDLL